jgi:hypothetical protein
MRDHFVANFSEFRRRFHDLDLVFDRQRRLILRVFRPKLTRLAAFEQPEERFLRGVDQARVDAAFLAAHAGSRELR